MGLADRRPALRRQNNQRNRQNKDLSAPRSTSYTCKPNQSSNTPIEQLANPQIKQSPTTPITQSVKQSNNQSTNKHSIDQSTTNPPRPPWKGTNVIVPGNEAVVAHRSEEDAVNAGAHESAALAQDPNPGQQRFHPAQHRVAQRHLKGRQVAAEVLESRWSGIIEWRTNNAL